jgi:acyl-CoA dehydrogenase
MPHSSMLSPEDLAPLRAVVEQTVRPAAKAADEGGSFPEHVYATLHAGGWLQGFVPESLGGQGLTTRQMAQIARCLGYGSGGVLTSSLINVLAMTPILLRGSPALQQATAARYVDEFALWAFAMTEPDAGFDVVNSRTRARRVDGGYRLNGAKCFITNGTVAHHFTVYAVLDGVSDGRKAGVLLYVPGDAEGLSRGTPLRKMGQHASDTSEVFFDDVFVPTEHRIGDEGEGLMLALHCVQRSKTIISAGAVGVADRIEDLTVEHLATRKRSSGPLLALPQLQSTLAKWHTRKEAAWLMALKAADAWDAGDATLEASMAKMFASDVTVNFANDAMELFGGYGYTDEYEISRIYRDAKLLEIYEGTTSIQRALVSRSLFGRRLRAEAQAARVAK